MCEEALNKSTREDSDVRGVKKLYFRDNNNFPVKRNLEEVIVTLEAGERRKFLFIFKTGV